MSDQVIQDVSVNLSDLDTSEKRMKEYMNIYNVENDQIKSKLKEGEQKQHPFRQLQNEMRIENPDKRSLFLYVPLKKDGTKDIANARLVRYKNIRDDSNVNVDIVDGAPYKYRTGLFSSGLSKDITLNDDDYAKDYVLYPLTREYSKSVFDYIDSLSSPKFSDDYAIKLGENYGQTSGRKTRRYKKKITRKHKRKSRKSRKSRRSRKR